MSRSGRGGGGCGGCGGRAGTGARRRLRRNFSAASPAPHHANEARGEHQSAAAAARSGQSHSKGAGREAGRGRARGAARADCAGRWAGVGARPGDGAGGPGAPSPPREPLGHGGSSQSRLGPGAARGAEEFSASPSRRGARDERAPARPQRGAAGRAAGLVVLRARVLKSLEFNLKTRSAHLPTRRSPQRIPNSLLFTAPIQEKAIKQ